MLTLNEANTTLQMLEQAMRGDDAATLTVDASALRSFDSAAVAVLLECRRLARAWSKGFEVRGAPPKLTELVRAVRRGPVAGLRRAAGCGGLNRALGAPSARHVALGAQVALDLLQHRPQRLRAERSATPVARMSMTTRCSSRDTIGL